MPAPDRRRGRLACLACLCIAAPAPAFAVEPVPAATRVAESVLRCTVGISCTTGDGGSFSGTGCVITPDGHVLTSTSVVPAGATAVKVLFPDFVRRDAALVAVDEGLAVALVKVDAEGLACLPLARGLPSLGTTTYTGSDVDQVLLSNGRASFSRGVVSGIYDVPRQGENGYAGIVVETTAAVNAGSDGGPLVDEQGTLCGVLSVGVSPLRWQGVAVPIKVLRERFAALRADGLRIVDAAGGAGEATAPADARLTGLRAAAAAITPHLVGIEVERELAPERLPLISWREYQSTIAGWDGLGEADRQQRFAAFANQARAFEVNQLLRRPPGPLTGLVVSADGFVLTSLFNIGDDTAFVSRKTGKPREFSAALPIEQLVAEPDGGFEQRPNPIRKVTVILPDGTRREAKVRARHEPLGIALIKIDAEDLAWFDLAAAAVSPQLGDPVAVLGYLGPGETAPARYTFNTGVVSAPARNRGQQFQTDALLNYGNSGGPVCDAAGNFLGIAAAPIEPDTVLGRLFTLPQLMRWNRAPNSGVGMVARADRIRGVLEALRSGRSFDRIPGPFMGVQADPSRAFGEDVVIGGVSPGSPAERAGMKKGDVLLEFDGEELRDWRDLNDRIAARKAGDSVTLVVRRRGSAARLVIAGRDVETLEDLQRLRRSLKPGDTFQGRLTADDTREIEVVLEENK